MRQRQLGNDGPQISEIGLGAWAIGGAWSWGWSEQDEQSSRETIATALDHGIDWIDTAPVYGLGHGEEVVGRAVGDRRNEVFLATKCGLRWDDQRRVTNNLHPASIRKECEMSLKRLAVDVIDLYQIHWPHSRVPVEESWGQMTRLVEEGKVRWIGVSNFGTELLERCQKIHPVQSVQPPYNMVHRDVEAEILPWCQANGAGVVAYSPLQSGLLTGKFSHEFKENLPEDDWRRNRSHFMFTDPLFSAVLAFVEGIRPIAKGCDRTVAELAIAWVLMHPAVTSAIAGARKPGQVASNMGGAGWRVSDEDMQRIDELYGETVAAVK